MPNRIFPVLGAGGVEFGKAGGCSMRMSFYRECLRTGLLGMTWTLGIQVMPFQTITGS
jgi:hypothetical protein